MIRKFYLIKKIQNSYKVQKAYQSLQDLFWLLISPFRRLLLPVVIRRREEVNIHFGCGDIADERFINVDARPLAHVHIVTKSPMLHAFSENTANSIYGCHVFEHLPFHTQKRILRRWISILKPGGWLRLSVPDFDKLVNKYQMCDRDPLSIQAPLMGGQDYPGNFHCAIFTDTHLKNLLRENGFINVTDWHPSNETTWPRDHSWTDNVSLNIMGQKPPSTR